MRDAFGHARVGEDRCIERILQSADIHDVIPVTVSDEDRPYLVATVGDRLRDGIGYLWWGINDDRIPGRFIGDEIGIGFCRTAGKLNDR